MAEFPALPFQQAVVARLRGAAAVAELVGDRVYDEPPHKGRLPLIRLGNVDWYPLPTDGCDAWRVLHVVEVHSRPDAGRVEAMAIAAAIIATLDRQEALLTVPGHVVSWHEMLTCTVDGMPDGKTYQASISFEAVLDVVP